MKTNLTINAALILLAGATLAGAADTINLKTLATEAGEIRLKDAGLSAFSLFEKAGLECAKGGGRTAYIIPKAYGRYKRLTEVNAAEAQSYVISSVNSDSAWIMACETKDGRFTVEKSYRSLTKGVETAYLRANRGLEGVDYVKDGGMTIQDSVYGYAPEDPIEKGRFRSQLAIEVSSLEMGFVRPHNGTRYVAEYNGLRGGCGHVSIKEAGSDGAAKEMVYGFKVCDGAAVSLGEREIKKDASKTMYANSF